MPVPSMPMSMREYARHPRPVPPHHASVPTCNWHMLPIAELRSQQVPTPHGSAGDGWVRTDRRCRLIFYPKGSRVYRCIWMEWWWSLSDELPSVVEEACNPHLAQWSSYYPNHSHPLPLPPTAVVGGIHAPYEMSPGEQYPPSYLPPPRRRLSTHPIRISCANLNIPIHALPLLPCSPDRCPYSTSYYYYHHPRCCCCCLRPINPPRKNRIDQMSWGVVMLPWMRMCTLVVRNSAHYKY